MDKLGKKGIVAVVAPSRVVSADLVVLWPLGFELSRAHKDSKKPSTNDTLP
ncbi:MAG: hypothetical protein ACI9MC_002693 [Kiritimatiellia bacterium]|jgi:hypothetical protein